VSTLTLADPEVEVQMHKPKKKSEVRIPANIVLAMAKRAFEEHKWSVRSDDNIKVIMSPMAGAQQVRILTRKEAIKLAAKQRLESWGYHTHDSDFKKKYVFLGVHYPFKSDFL
jgi:hypothetical protein